MLNRLQSEKKIKNRIRMRIFFGVTSRYKDCYPYNAKMKKDLH